MTTEMDESRNLLILKTEQEQTKNRLKDQISIARNIIDNLDKNLEKGNIHLSSSDGLAGNSSSIDIYLNQYISYTRAIELFEREFKNK